MLMSLLTKKNQCHNNTFRLKRLNFRINNKGSDVHPAIDREFTQSFLRVMRGYKNEQVYTNLCYMKAMQRHVPFSHCYQIKYSVFTRCNTCKLFTSRLD